MGSPVRPQMDGIEVGSKDIMAGNTSPMKQQMLENSASGVLATIEIAEFPSLRGHKATLNQ